METEPRGLPNEVAISSANFLVPFPPKIFTDCIRLKIAILKLNADVYRD
jgi:hypothetical protein